MVRAYAVAAVAGEPFARVRFGGSSPTVASFATDWGWIVSGERDGTESTPSPRATKRRETDAPQPYAGDPVMLADLEHGPQWITLDPVADDKGLKDLSGCCVPPGKPLRIGQKDLALNQARTGVGCQSIL